MGQAVYVLGLFFIAGAVSASSVDQYPEKNVKKSSLILEYNWPEPSKSLNRLPHPRSCNHFIHTKHDGSHVVKRCHGDKIFDYRSLRCQNKHSAKCWMNIVKKDNIKKVKRPFSCPFPWGLYPDKADCSLFYECMGGKIYPRKCPDSTLFDAVERICVHSKKALCAQDKDITAKDRGTSQPLVLLQTTASERGMDSEEDNSEEINRKHRTRSQSKFVSSKLPFISTSSANSESLRTNEYSEGEDSSEEKYNKISYELKSKTPKIESSSGSTYNEMLTSKSATSFTEKRLITPSLQSSDSSELPIQSTIISSTFVSFENNGRTSTTISPENNEKDISANDNTEKISSPTERMLKELASSAEPSRHDSLKPVKITVSHEVSKANTDENHEITKVTTPILSTSKEPTSSSEFPTDKKLGLIESISQQISKSDVTTFSSLCLDAEGYYPHPENGNLFIACSGGKPTVMQCPEGEIYFHKARTCHMLH